ncbi:hypothetical protein CYMTET_24974 [Cymbomonas tetramitiformis]|uniref:Dienelactone hydrolase domain-containing protein n=1 Tax=Cymbomonas tetramitiformis TaxID=36881 RepID=A0AAE0FVI3_9CHLO|nr:hypothetical protein CYMTET_24974 [Cymbomonas tetramitiformis]
MLNFASLQSHNHVQKKQYRIMRNVPLLRNRNPSIPYSRGVRALKVCCISSPCCPQKSEPVTLAASDYVPLGKTYTLSHEDGSEFVTVYVSPPPKASSSAILVAHDIGGPYTGRHREVCDQLAKEGYWVAMPDLFQGSMPEELPPWYGLPLLIPKALGNINRPWSSTEPELRKVIEHLVTEEGVDRIGILGFCYGAFIVFKVSGEEFSHLHPQVKCGVSMHPSVHNVASFKGEDQWDIVQSVSVPQMILATNGEPADWRPGGKTERVLQNKQELPEPRCVFDIFPNRLHGFFTRGDPHKADVKKDMDRAFELTLEFLRQHL